MTRVRIDNSGHTGTARYIELNVTNTFTESYSNDVISFNLPVPRGNWTTSIGTKKFIDFKQHNKQYTIGGLIDKTSSFTSSAYTTVSSLTDVQVVRGYLENLFENGGIVNLKVKSGSRDETITGMITNLSFTEVPEDQSGTAAPDVLTVDLTFVKGENQ